MVCKKDSVFLLNLISHIKSLKNERVVALAIVVVFVFSMSSQNIFANHWEENNIVIDSDFDDNLEVVYGHRVTITGATIGGNVDVDGGFVTVKNSSTVDGNIEIKNSAVTITDSIIDGNVNVDGGMVIIKNDSTVDGNIEIKNGGRVILDDVVIDGNVKAEDSGFVIMTGNSIDGNIEIINHKGMCFLMRNLVDGNNSGCL